MTPEVKNKRKRRPHETPLNLPVETIWWHDASRHDREELDYEMYILVTSSAIVFEDDTQIIIGYELKMDEKWDLIKDGVDFTKIPKASILKRIRHGSIEVMLADDVIQNYIDRIRHMGEPDEQTNIRIEQKSTRSGDSNIASM